MLLHYVNKAELMLFDKMMKISFISGSTGRECTADVGNNRYSIKSNPKVLLIYRRGKR